MTAPTTPRERGLARLDTLRGIGLDELNAAAQLQTRIDRKYAVPAAALPAVLSDLPAGTAVLRIDGASALRYSSRYFDTPDLASYLGAARGRRRRFKVRSRTYLDAGASFLEVKTRGARAATVKDRLPLTADELDADARRRAAGMLAEAGIPGSDEVAAHLSPTLETSYRRVTLLLPAAGDGTASRATIDVELAFTAVDGRRLALPRTVVVETKSPSRPGTLDRALWRHGLRPVPLSKYGAGMAALDPRLPSHKWRRVLTRHFASARVSFDNLSFDNLPSTTSTPLTPTTVSQKDPS